MNDDIKELLSEFGVDMQRTLERFLQNESMYIKFLKKFSADPNYAMLLSAVQNNDTQEVERTAHTMKGIAANLGLEPIQLLLQKMVDAVRLSKLDLLPTYIQQLELLNKQLQSIVQQLA